MIISIILAAIIGGQTNQQYAEDFAAAMKSPWVILGTTTEMTFAVNKTTIRRNVRQWGTKDTFVLVVSKDSSESDILGERFSVDYCRSISRALPK